MKNSERPVFTKAQKISWQVERAKHLRQTEEIKDRLIVAIERRLDTLEKLEGQIDSEFQAGEKVNPYSVGAINNSYRVLFEDARDLLEWGKQNGVNDPLEVLREVFETRLQNSNSTSRTAGLVAGSEQPTASARTDHDCPSMDGFGPPA